MSDVSNSLGIGGMLSTSEHVLPRQIQVKKGSVFKHIKVIEVFNGNVEYESTGQGVVKATNTVAQSTFSEMLSGIEIGKIDLEKITFVNTVVHKTSVTKLDKSKRADQVKKTGSNSGGCMALVSKVAVRVFGCPSKILGKVKKEGGRLVKQCREASISRAANKAKAAAAKGKVVPDGWRVEKGEQVKIGPNKDEFNVVKTFVENGVSMFKIQGVGVVQNSFTISRSDLYSAIQETKGKVFSLKKRVKSDEETGVVVGQNKGKVIIEFTRNLHVITTDVEVSPKTALNKRLWRNKVKQLSATVSDIKYFKFDEKTYIGDCKIKINDFKFPYKDSDECSFKDAPGYIKRQIYDTLKDDDMEIAVPDDLIKEGLEVEIEQENKVFRAD